MRSADGRLRSLTALDCRDRVVVAGQIRSLQWRSSLRSMLSVRYVDLASVPVLGNQITGVKAKTRHVMMDMSAAGRSGRNELHAQCPTYVSKWPEGAVADSVIHARSWRYSGNGSRFVLRPSAYWGLAAVAVGWSPLTILTHHCRLA